MTDTDRSDTLIPDEGLAPASTALPTADVMEELATPPRSQWRDVWDQFKSHKGAMLGAMLFIFIVAAVYLGPYLWTIDPTQIDIRSRNQGPSLAHPFGTDQLGRDILARMMSGGQTSVSVVSLRCCWRCSWARSSGFWRGSSNGWTAR